MVLLTLVNVLLALVPRAVMAVMHTTIIRASMTAYSTAVGPSSRFMKFTTAWVRYFIFICPFSAGTGKQNLRPQEFASAPAAAAGLRSGRNGSVQSYVVKRFVGVGAQSGDGSD